MILNLLGRYDYQPLFVNEIEDNICRMRCSHGSQLPFWKMCKHNLEPPMEYKHLFNWNSIHFSKQNCFTLREMIVDHLVSSSLTLEIWKARDLVKCYSFVSYQLHLACWCVFVRGKWTGPSPGMSFYPAPSKCWLQTRYPDGNLFLIVFASRASLCDQVHNSYNWLRSQGIMLSHN